MPPFISMGVNNTWFSNREEQVYNIRLFHGQNTKIRCLTYSNQTNSTLIPNPICSIFPSPRGRVWSLPRTRYGVKGRHSLCLDPAGFNPLSPFHRDSYPFQALRRIDDNRLRPAQEDLQAFFLYGRMKAADDAQALITPFPGLIHGRQDGISGT